MDTFKLIPWKHTAYVLFTLAIFLLLSTVSNARQEQELILFLLDDDIYLMNADGSEQRNLTNTPDVTEFDPSWSPDGEQIAFGINPFDNPEIVVMSVDGTNYRNVSDNSASDFIDSWSPDGSKILFSSNRAETGTFEIYVIRSYAVEFAGKGLKPLVQAENPVQVRKS